MSRLALVNSCANVGIDATTVNVEIHLSNGLPKFTLVGLPEAAVKESKERVRSAIINSQFKFPSNYHITVSLAPADLPKTGARFDLPIAIGILVASGQLHINNIQDFVFVGELALTGNLRPVNALLPVAIDCQLNNKTLFMPQPKIGELIPIDGLKAISAKSLIQICRHFQNAEKLEPWYEDEIPQQAEFTVDMSDVKGMAQGRRALEIAAAGRHNMLLTGPPGTGKSMLAERMITILPKLSQQQAIEVAALYSTAGVPRLNKLDAPYRHPHHSSSNVAIVGGGSNPQPGEISLAHWGVLFLDELPEFNRQVMESLREPIESKNIVISRSQHKVKYPSNFQLVAARNPCPCGYRGDRQRKCDCSDLLVSRYQSKISGPMLDRIDLQVRINRPSDNLLLSKTKGESSDKIRQRVEQARTIQLNRQNCTNADLSATDLEKYIKLSKTNTDIIKDASEKLQLSPRAIHRTIKVSRTIADLANALEITDRHIFEALGFRQS